MDFDVRAAVDVMAKLFVELPQGKDTAPPLPCYVFLLTTKLIIFTYIPFLYQLAL